MKPPRIDAPINLVKFRPDTSRRPIVYTDAFNAFWQAYPRYGRKGKQDAFAAFQRALKSLPVDEIMRRLAVFKVSQPEWYNFCYPQKFLNWYLDDYEGEELPPKEGSDEWWAARCEDGLRGPAGREHFHRQGYPQICPQRIKDKYPELFK